MALSCPDVSKVIPRIFRDWRQSAAYGGTQLHTENH
jgi:hypothetical protein